MLLIILRPQVYLSTGRTVTLRAFRNQEKEVKTFPAEVIFVKLYSFLLFIILSLQPQPEPTVRDCHRNTRSIWDA